MFVVLVRMDLLLIHETFEDLPSDLVGLVPIDIRVEAFEGHVVKIPVAEPSLQVGKDHVGEKRKEHAVFLASEARQTLRCPVDRMVMVHPHAMGPVPAFEHEGSGLDRDNVPGLPHEVVLTHEVQNIDIVLDLDSVQPERPIDDLKSCRSPLLLLVQVLDAESELSAVAGLVNRDDHAISHVGVERDSVRLGMHRPRIPPRPLVADREPLALACGNRLAVGRYPDVLRAYHLHRDRRKLCDVRGIGDLDQDATEVLRCREGHDLAGGLRQLSAAVDNLPPKPAGGSRRAQHPELLGVSRVDLRSLGTEGDLERGLILTVIVVTVVTVLTDVRNVDGSLLDLKVLCGVELERLVTGVRHPLEQLPASHTDLLLLLLAQDLLHERPARSGDEPNPSLDDRAPEELGVEASPVWRDELVERVTVTDAAETETLVDKRRRNLRSKIRSLLIELTQEIPERHDRVVRRDLHGLVRDPSRGDVRVELPSNELRKVTLRSGQFAQRLQRPHLVDALADDLAGLQPLQATPGGADANNVRDGRSQLPGESLDNLRLGSRDLLPIDFLEVDYRPSPLKIPEVWGLDGLKWLFEPIMVEEVLEVLGREDETTDRFAELAATRVDDESVCELEVGKPPTSAPPDGRRVGRLRRDAVRQKAVHVCPPESVSVVDVPEDVLPPIHKDAEHRRVSVTRVLRTLTARRQEHAERGPEGLNRLARHGANVFGTDAGMQHCLGCHFVFLTSLCPVGR